jgi:glycogen operon protein
VKLIAEPWDIGHGGYQVGGFPNGWSEWNDVYRRSLRRFWRGDGDLLGELARAMTGSAPQFQHDSRGPRSSINFVTVHDGFTLADLFSYETKHNEANGEDNRDGGDDNDSTNCGVEGPTEDVGILERRRRLRRNQLACLLLAQGVPLILAGDEVGNSQNGNNNAYCQDNEIGWVDWSALGGSDDMIDFVGGLVKLRNAFPQLKPHRWLDGQRPNGSYDVQWLTPAGTEMTEEDWNFPGGRFLAYVLNAVAEGGRPLYIAINGAADALEVAPPEWSGVSQWARILDTAADAPLQESGPLPAGQALNISPDSVVAFAGLP